MYLRPVVLALVVGTVPVQAQEWQAGAQLPIIVRASDQRSASDSSRRAGGGWQAEAHGIVRFVAKVDHGGRSVERLIKVDELKVQVYGEAPNRSKQVIIAWRDSVLSPTNITYHRDHLGIVSHDFGNTIRLGQGDEVSDVVHPLSAAGLSAYKFRPRDTITVAQGTNVLRVLRVDVAPLDPSRPAVLGTMLLDLDRAALVRFRFTFTASSYRDPTVEGISVTLENSLFENQLWVPFRQSIVINRSSQLVALPITFSIEADWEIGGYRLGISYPTGFFAGRKLAGLDLPGGDSWQEPLEVLRPESSDWTTELTNQIATMTAERLAGSRAIRLSARDGLSALVHVNRVEGVTLGAGLVLSIGRNSSIVANLGVGTSGKLVTSGVLLERSLHSLRPWLGIERSVDAVGSGQQGSTLVNSVTTLLSGSDSRDWFLRESVGFGLSLERGSKRLDLGVSREWVSSLMARFTALDGTRHPNPDLGGSIATVAKIGFAARGTDLNWVELTGQVGLATDGWSRAAVSGQFAIPGGIIAGFGGTLSGGSLPLYQAFVAGGRGSLVGQPSNRWGGSRGARLELSRPIKISTPTPKSGGLTRGSLPAEIGPTASLVLVGGGYEAGPWSVPGGMEASFGVRLDLFGDLVRIESGWDPRRGRLGLTLDAHPDWWPFL